MTIRAKTALSILVALLCSALVSFFISGTVISREADETARLDADDAAQLVIRVLRHDFVEMTRISIDWGIWDDTYEFVTTRNPEYIEKNLDDETLEQNKFDFIVVADAQKKPILVSGYSRREERRIDTVPGLDRFLELIPIQTLASADNRSEGLWAFEGAWYLVAIQPITPGLREKPPAGVMVIGRVVDADRIQELAQLTGLEIREATTAEIGTPEKPAANGPETRVLSADDGMIGIASLPDLFGRGQMVLAVRPTPREGKRVAQNVLLVLVMLVGSGLLVSLVATTSVGRILVRRLERLHQFVAVVQKTGEFTRRIDIGGEDEISELGQAFNAMLDRIGKDVLRLRSGADALRDSLQMTADIIEYMPVGIMQWKYARDAERLLLIDANPVAEKLTGLRAGTRVGEEFDAIFPVAHSTGIKEHFLEVMRGGERLDTDDLAILDDNVNVAFHIYAFALPQERLCVVLEDIMHRKVAGQERSKLEEQLRQAQKMEAIGRLAGGVAHDFNNILTTISGYTNLLIDEMDPENPMFEDLSEIRSAAERAAQLTSQLLAFSRRQIYSPRVIELNEVLLRSSKMLRRMIGEDVEMSTHVAGVDLRLRADPLQIDQILINLVVNARDALPANGWIKIVAEARSVDDAFATRYSEAKPGEYVVLSVSDNGTGMSPETLSQIFEPFFTTKEKGKGTGLGLSTVYGIVKQNGGFVTVTSAAGAGSTFDVYLPRIEEPDFESPKSTDGHRTGGSETVLLVEDERGVRQLAERILKSAGYRVIPADHPTEALELCSQCASEIDLLLTDVVMPGMNGVELYRTIKAAKPDLHAVFMSGYADNALTLDNVLSGEMPFLAKPFVARDLLHLVRSVLDGVDLSTTTPEQ